jgi:hypothetical protein
MGLMLLAVALAIFAVLLWFVLVRRLPEETGAATIIAKTFRSAGIYTQQMVGADRAFRVPTEIPVAETYVFELAVDGLAQPVRVSLNTVKSREFQSGQRVQVRYVRRGLAPFRGRVMVMEMSPLDGP